MNKKALLFSFSLALVASFFFNEANLALALDSSLKPDSLPTYDFGSINTTGSDPEVVASKAVSLFIGNLVSQVLLFAGAVTIIFLIMSGRSYIFSLGDDTKIDQGKRGMYWSLIGLVVIMLSYALTRGIISLILRLDS